jgi:hypothetical protein
MWVVFELDGFMLRFAVGLRALVMHGFEKGVALQ